MVKEGLKYNRSRSRSRSKSKLKNSRREEKVCIVRENSEEDVMEIPEDVIWIHVNI